MCGIAGILGFKGQEIPGAWIKRMCDTIRHRGPDGDGYFLANTHSGGTSSGFGLGSTVPGANLALGHRRLSILELTELGRQPMRADDGLTVITYNGEIYNHLELRKELCRLGHEFHSRSDTETILGAYRQWGESCMEHFNGMFAFAIWDGAGRKLFLARDRYGIKPLYYLANDQWFIFASEIKAILAHPAVQRGVCYEALNEYFTFQNILTDHTLFAGIHLLPPGNGMVVRPEEPGQVRRWQYWDFTFGADFSSNSFEENSERLETLFSNAVERQLLSDVPIGSYLSGGMDSGSIVAVASNKLGRMATFTCGFDMSSVSGLELGIDERANSEVLANLLKTEHYEMVLHAGDMEHIMPELIWHVEDLRVGQCYPNYYVARLAGKFVKVCLSGAGGDEIFAGYPWRYFRGSRSRNTAEFEQNYYDFWQRLVPDGEKQELFPDSIWSKMNGHSSFDVFRSVLRGFKHPLESVDDFVNASLYFEAKTFLHGLLIVEDRVSMAHSLETRVPFLDNPLVEFGMNIPIQHKLRQLKETNMRVDEDDVGKRFKFEIRSGDGKMVLRHAMTKLIPHEITNRIKQGFSAPDGTWFRGESIDYINKTLRSKNARIYDLVDPRYVARILDEHCSGKANHRLLIWSFLSLEHFCHKFL
jgi:asparagine synthase (glutamine-hydrolysing)